MSSAVNLQVGNAVTRHEACGAAAARRVAALLDLDPAGYPEGRPLPRGWQFILLGADKRKSELRDDGFPGLGVPLPDLGLPSLVLGGRTVHFEADIPIGASISRTSSVAGVTRKGTESNPMALVTVRHELRLQGEGTAAVVETQTYVLLAKRTASPGQGKALQWVDVACRKTIVPDDTMLFQYSALGFNSHKIHLDRAYARDVEGYPELVVNGGLSTLFLTELLRNELGLLPRALAIRHHAPLFCGQPVELTAESLGDKWRLRACNEQGQLCTEMEVDAVPGASHGV